MSCSKCGNLIGCGCTDTALTTVPTIPGPLCINPEPCSELISSDCVFYAGPSTGLPCDILINDRFTVVIEKLIACAISADETVKVSVTDTTAGFLQPKLVAGTGITINLLNPGANEQLEIASTIIEPAAHLLTGNTLTGVLPETPTEFIGTLNLFDYIMKVNNIEALRLNTNLTMNSPSFPAVPVFAEPVKNGDWWFEDVAGVTYLVRVNSLGVTQKVQLT